MCDFLNLCGFFHDAQKVNLGLVILGGAFGGFLQPVVATLAPQLESPENGVFSLNSALCSLLGAAAAGISAYVLTDAGQTPAVRLLFLSVVSGLAFPAVLRNAVDSRGQQTKDLLQRMARIADETEAEGLTETARAARELRVALAQNPPDSIKPASQAVIDTMAQQAVNNIAQTEAKTQTDQRKVIAELTKVGTVAQTSGWEKTLQTVIDQLEGLSKTFGNQDIKAEAQQAAKGLSEGDAAP
ncbi:MAG: hypothetical protein J7496_12125 [Novosphingobium sp.]|nr:hypothetical protein [Novosphingobium sp.]